MVLTKILWIFSISSLIFGIIKAESHFNSVKRIVNAHDMVLIPEAKFTAGHCSLTSSARKKLVENEDVFLLEIPARKNLFSFLLADHEVTVGEYMNFVSEVTGYANMLEVPVGYEYSFILKGENISTSILPKLEASSGLEDQYLTDKKFKNYPIVGVSWYQAAAYIYWLNTKVIEKYPSHSLQFILPSPLQMEYACSMRPKKRTKKEILSSFKYYPWLNEDLYNKDGKLKANLNTKHSDFLSVEDNRVRPKIKPIRSFDSYSKIYDIAGNVSEWTMSLEGEYTDYLDSESAFVKGGSYLSDPIFAQCGISQIHSKSLQSNEIGFRIGMWIEDRILKNARLK